MVPIYLEFQLLWLKIHILFFLSIEGRKNSDKACFGLLYKINQGDRSNSKKEGFLLGKGFRLRKIGFKIQVQKKKFSFFNIEIITY